MGPVGWWTARDLRRRWRSLAVLALLVAFAGGTALAAFAGARRNASAFDRLQARSRGADVMALPNTPGFDWDAVRALPEVEDVATFAVAQPVVDHVGPDHVFFAVSSREFFTSVERGVVLAGRRFDVERADEVMISPAARSVLHLDVGDSVILRSYKPEDVDATWSAPTPTPPNGPMQRARVVGVLRFPFSVAFGGDSGAVLISPGYFAKYAANIVPSFGFENALIRLRHGDRDVPALERALNDVAGHPVDIQRTALVAQAVSDATRFEANALIAFGIAAAAASLFLIAQALARTAILPSSDVQVLRGFGMSRGQRTLAGALSTVVAGVLGALGAVAFAYALSPRFPIGVGRGAEPTPGLRFDAGMLAPGAVVIALVVGGAAIVLAARSSVEEHGRVPRRSSIGRLAERFDAPLPVALGTRLALERGRGRTAVPVGPALVGAMVGVLGIVGAFTFRAGLDHATATPALFGQRHDATADVFPPTVRFEPESVRKLVRDDDVAFVDDSPITVTAVDGEPLTLFTLDELKGTMPITILDGRRPRTANEMVLGPDELDLRGLHVGDEVTAGDGGRFTVIGRALMPLSPHTGYTNGGWVTREGLERIAPNPKDWKFHGMLIGFADGVDPAAAIGKVSERTGLELTAASLPEEFGNLRRVRTVPLALGAFLVLLAVGAVGHALMSAVRRRRYDIAVLRSLGMTRRQSRWCVVAQATTLALVGLAVGIPAGVLAGRALWRSVADTTPLLYRGPIAVAALVVVPVAALAISNALATLPARRAARLEPAEVLRSE
jgi:hypothetical protein